MTRYFLQMPYSAVGNAEKESPCGCRHGALRERPLKGLAFVETEVGAAVSGHDKAAGGLLHLSTEESGSWLSVPISCPYGPRDPGTAH